MILREIVQERRQVSVESIIRLPIGGEVAVDGDRVVVIIERVVLPLEELEVEVSALVVLEMEVPVGDFAADRAEGPFVAVGVRAMADGGEPDHNFIVAQWWSSDWGVQSAPGLMEPDLRNMS